MPITVPAASIVAVAVAAVPEITPPAAGGLIVIVGAAKYTPPPPTTLIASTVPVLEPVPSSARAVAVVVELRIGLSTLMAESGAVRSTITSRVMSWPGKNVTCMGFVLVEIA